MELIKGSKKFKKNLEEKERRSETQIHFTLRNEDGWERQTRTDWYSCSRGAHFTWGGGKNVRGVSPGFLKPLTARHLPLCPVHCTCPLLPLFFNVLFNSLYIYNFYSHNINNFTCEQVPVLSLITVLLTPPPVLF